mmetsp:Transcript_13450/g.31880  ORF Transcript_13450/g.31880 Transcript_13450/m.31880 type:complete len:214 (+) Transcript_13450:1947-2588(+)
MCILILSEAALYRKLVVDFGVAHRLEDELHFRQTPVQACIFPQLFCLHPLVNPKAQVVFQLRVGDAVGDQHRVDVFALHRLLFRRLLDHELHLVVDADAKLVLHASALYLLLQGGLHEPAHVGALHLQLLLSLVVALDRNLVRPHDPPVRRLLLQQLLLASVRLFLASRQLIIQRLQLLLEPLNQLPAPLPPRLQLPDVLFAAGDVQTVQALQ